MDIFFYVEFEADIPYQLNLENAKNSLDVDGPHQGSNLLPFRLSAFPRKVKIVSERQKLEGGFPWERYLFNLYQC